MAKYRKVETRIWSDAKFMALPELSKFVFLFLLTHPSLTAIGGMRASVPGLAAELRMEPKKFTHAFNELQPLGMLAYDGDAPLLVITNFLRYNKPESPNVVKSWSSVFESLPECPLRDQLGEKLQALISELPASFQEGFRKGFANPSERDAGGFPEEVTEGLPKDVRDIFPNPEPEPLPEPEPFQEPSSKSKAKPTPKNSRRKQQATSSASRSKTNGAAAAPEGVRAPEEQDEYLQRCP